MIAIFMCFHKLTYKKFYYYPYFQLLMHSDLFYGVEKRRHQLMDRQAKKNCLWRISVILFVFWGFRNFRKVRISGDSQKIEYIIAGKLDRISNSNSKFHTHTYTRLCVWGGVSCRPNNFTIGSLKKGEKSDTSLSLVFIGEI